LKIETYTKLISFGSLHLDELCVIEVCGDQKGVFDFLQGQVTSDLNEIEENQYQASSICDHKGQILADFIIHRNKNLYILIDRALKDIFIKEMSPFAAFSKAEFIEKKYIVTGSVEKSEKSDNHLISNEEFAISVRMDSDKGDIKAKLISHSQWKAANMIIGNLSLNINNTGKYRPSEINYDRLRVSFTKGCYRGQEIVARMKYLGIDRRKFCTVIVKKDEEFCQNSIKIVSEIENLEEFIIFNAIIKKVDIDLVKESSQVIVF